MKKEDFQLFVQEIIDNINQGVFAPIYDELQRDPDRRTTLNPAFPYPKKIRIGALKNHLVVEYVGSEDTKNPEYEVEAEWSPQKSVLEFFGLDFSNSSTPIIPYPENLENIQMFLGEAMGLLGDYLYDLVLNPNDILMNGFVDFSAAQKPIIVSNTTVFWSDDEGIIKTRRIDFAEIFPTPDGYYYRTPESLKFFSDAVLNYKVPKYKLDLHQEINDFIALVNSDASEPQITKYLAEHPEILQLAFGSHDLNPEIELKWQYETDKANLKPDFMPIKMDGYADIIEFKLPDINGSPMVGTPTRHRPSSQIDAALAQIDEYADWCKQEVNQKWLEETHGIKVYSPKTLLIVGHSDKFSSEDRQKLKDRRNASILTYDEFIDLARCQLYRIR
ncbi:MAG: DUF4263 domain-containing protein [Acinetobacter sp.]|nr:DUF4263 domain-containing protein [Acinetobacter sp.]MDN5625380.1 DUF4263 domain-containing protein [Acinetobacter sp.]MDN5649650.1 DUF4263 domain-containing protein [Acinetobacter sp.]